MTKNLQLESATARKLYKTAVPEFKAILEESFGKEFFSEKITDRINSFLDVLAEAVQWFNSVKDNQSSLKTKIQKETHDIVLNHIRGGRVTAADKVRLIAFVLNEGWEEDFKNDNQQKFYPWFERKSSGWSFFRVSFYCYDYAHLGAGSYFKEEKLVRHAWDKCKEVYLEHLPE